MRDSVVRLCFEVARFQHTTLGPLGCGLMVCHALMDCHPERSSRFAKRSSYVVEGPLHLRHSQRSIKAFSLRFGRRNDSPLSKDLPLSPNGKGTASAVPPRANKGAGFSP